MRTVNHRGVILIIVLWFIAVVTILIAALASEVRLSARAVFHTKENLQIWNDTLKAVQMAEMELLINRMPDPPGTEQSEVPLSERKNKAYRFDGRILELAYPVPKTVTVRIYDHAGKIGLPRLTPQKMRLILKKRQGDDLEKLQALEDAWQDWVDGDDLKRLTGAEKDYYEKLTPPYQPRNGLLETVEELLLIKGFADVFKNLDMNSAFTMYNNTQGINPNLATREALLLLPGMDEATADMILTQRREKEFKSNQDFNELIPPEQLAEFLPWLNYANSNVFTIAVQVKKDAEVVATDKTPPVTETNDESETTPSEPPAPEPVPAARVEERAYMVTVQFRNFNQPPKVLMVNPYGVLPDHRHESTVQTPTTTH